MTMEEMERQQTHAETRSAPSGSSPVTRPVVKLFAILRDLFGKPESQGETVREAATVSDTRTWKLEVNVEPDELDGGFVAECVDVPGAMAQGETEEEALRNVIDAVQAVVAAKMQERFEEVKLNVAPEPISRGIGRRISVTF